MADLKSVAIVAAGSLSSAHLAQDVARSLTCEELDGIACLLWHTGHRFEAITWLQMHATDPEESEDDRHHGVDVERYAREQL